ncbi:hypothetical protein DITRI_Ditri11bG0026800 [Diplodiscus trichospermus]
MNPSSLELSLSLKPSYVPKSLSNVIFDLSKIDNDSDKLSVLSDYIYKHEEELSRIEALKHELPQCRLLLMESIEILKEEFIYIKNDMESQRGKPDPVEYLPTKSKNSEQEQREIWEITCSNFQYGDPGYAKKRKTLSINNFQTRNPKAIHPCEDCRNMEGLLLPYKESTSNSHESPFTGKEKEVATMGQSSRNYNQRFLYLIKADGIQTLNYKPKPLTQPIWKKNRRCWSSELHARFLETLDLLGGIEVATPKQIRDLMQVEGLTIDQVKSHLQKYRLHCGKAVVGSHINCWV